MNAPADARSYPQPVVAWLTVLALSVTYLFSFMDRQILVLLVDPIRQDLGISDTQVSLLTGLAFAAVYSVMGLPLGRLADLWIRKYVVMAGVAIWSSLTIACGLAQNFVQLFLARMGIGFGEAALTPTAYAIIADLFPPDKLARGMSVFVIGGFVGMGGALVFSGLIIRWVESIGAVTVPVIGLVPSWQMVLIAVGSLSLLMLIPLAFVPEPKRHSIVSGTDVSTNEDTRTVSFVFGYLRRHLNFYGPYIGGILAINIFAYGSAAWLPSYFIRVHEWEPATTGIAIGSIAAPMLVLGGIAAGWFSDVLYRRGRPDAGLLILTIATVLYLPTPALIVLVPAMWAKMLFLGFSFFVYAMSFAVAPTVIQIATPAGIRAQVSAIYLMVVNIVGIGFGPTIVALLTDKVFHDGKSIGYSLVVSGTICYAVGVLLLHASRRQYLRSVSIGENTHG